MSKNLLKEALQVYNLPIVKEENNLIYLQNEYIIEVEDNDIYKLSQDNYIIAPFSDLNELCTFVLQDQ